MKSKSLLASTVAGVLGVVVSPAYAADWPSGYTKCADNGGICAAGTKLRRVSYGAQNKWIIKNLSGNVACNKATFGDPIRGVRKSCAVGPLVTAPPPTACDTLSRRVRTTSLAVGGSVAPSDANTQAVIAPRADGTSVVAWTDSSLKRIRMASLSTADVLERTLPGVAGLEVHAALATQGGTALVVMDNDPDIYSAKYCQGSSTPDKAVCGKMDLVRVDTNGATLSRTTLTKKINVDTDDALFTWWYGHPARLATDGTRFAVYFGSAGSTDRPGVPGEVDIHQGDTLKFVDARNGALLAGGWDWGCSHSWAVRMAFNGQKWAAACHGDAFPNAMRIARLGTPTTTADSLQWLSNTNPSQRALGGLVPSRDGFWLNYIQSNNGVLSLQLAKVPNSGTALVQQRAIARAAPLDSSYPFRPYMAAYGSGKLLMGWKSGGRLMLAVADATSGAVLEGPVATALDIDQFQDMTTAPNGDVLWAHSEGGSVVGINRVAACKLTN